MNGPSSWCNLYAIVAVTARTVPSKHRMSWMKAPIALQSHNKRFADVHLAKSSHRPACTHLIAAGGYVDEYIYDFT